MAQIKHYGKPLSRSQMGALTFALTEGEVGPGCDAGTARVTSATVQYLIGAGLATTEGVPACERDGKVWVRLTYLGKAVARRVFEASRGFAWKSADAGESK